MQSTRSDGSRRQTAAVRASTPSAAAAGSALIGDAADELRAA